MMPSLIFLTAASVSCESLRHFVGDDRETASGLAGAGGLDGRIEREQVGLAGNVPDQVDQGLQRAGFLDRFGAARLVRGGLFDALGDEGFELADQLAIAADLLRIRAPWPAIRGGGGHEAVEVGDHLVDRLQARGDVVGGLFGLLDDARNWPTRTLLKRGISRSSGIATRWQTLFDGQRGRSSLRLSSMPMVGVVVEERARAPAERREEQQTEQGHQGVDAAIAESEGLAQKFVVPTVQEEDDDDGTTVAAMPVISVRWRYCR
jgi:hypothetical protein